MNFTAYIQKQKNLIRSRHEEETFLNEKGEYISVSDRDRLLDELDSIYGLNVPERAKFGLRRGASA